ncbi:MAG: YdiU family protein [Rhizobiaceae bacterium]
MHPPSFNFDNSYARELEGFYVPWEGARVPAPRMLRLNRALARELGLDPDALDTEAGAAMLAGMSRPEGAEPLAMAYAGHQFGGFSPQLGDGRALLVGEVIDRDGRRRDIHLKGSGRTPFSRGGDGKAVLGPVLREYVIGEAMHALGIPTTRALAAVTTGEEVIRDGYKPGAVLARVASSHLRVGTFQFFAARGETERVRRLADYAIGRHFPDLADRDTRYLGLLARVRDTQAALVARWVLVGFVHGVMNTDNMAISGETIDYGPCAFIDSYDPKAVFSSIDQFGRYAYGNQPTVAQWNLARFAETLLDLINPDDGEDAVRQATDEINRFPETYQAEWLKGMRAKLGLLTEQPDDNDLANALFAAMEGKGVDFTLFFRRLSDLVRGNPAPERSLFADPAALDGWLERYERRLADEDVPADARAGAMDRINPLHIPRNHKVEEALEAALAGDMAPFDRLLQAVTAPFEERAGLESYAEPAPKDFGPYTTFCGT